LKAIIDYKSDGSLNALFKYTLDSLGNRTLASLNQPMNAIPSQPDASYTYNVDNRLLTSGSTTFEYDNNGNLITKTLGGNVTNYTWDLNDMLTQLTSGGNTYTYRYDGLGNRVARIENSVEKRYVSGLAETDASGNITAYYVYGLGLISKITPSNQSYFYHFDGIGSTVGISDSSGNMVNKYAYDAFGKVLAQDEGIPNPFKYVGGFGVMDEGNGLFYMRARYYDPEVGRFINKDPIGFAGGLNLFQYVANNPVNKIDPEGEGLLLMGVCIGAFALSGASTVYSVYELNKEAEPIEEKMTALLKRSKKCEDVEEMGKILGEFEKLSKQLDRIARNKVKEELKGGLILFVITVLCLAFPTI
jgi:RHS repeat-associated protein